MSEDIHETAARWHVAQQRDDMDWEGFADWLGADPSHRHAYDDIALLDARIDAARPALAGIAMPEAETAPSAHRVPRWMVGSGIAAAAAIALVVGIGTATRQSEPAAQRFASATGTTRTVQLAEGVNATLGSNSELLVPRSGGAFRLKGSAYFNVRHDPDRAVTVAVAGYRIRDIGTRFAVNSGNGVFSVAVEEGSVGLRPAAGGAETRIAAGEQALVQSDHIELRRIGTRSIASWRHNRFVYDDAPIALIAADIARYTGEPVEVDPAIAGRRFSGVLAAGDRQTMVAMLTQLTGLDAKRDDRTIRLVDRTGG